MARRTIEIKAAPGPRASVRITVNLSEEGIVLMTKTRTVRNLSHKEFDQNAMVDMLQAVAVATDWWCRQYELMG